MDSLSSEIFGSDHESYEGESERLHRYHGGRPQLFSEEQEIDLASELLTLSNDHEMEQFFGDLIKKVGSFAGKVIKGPVGSALGGLLKTAAKAALPAVGGALGTLVAGPAGTAIGSQLASRAGQLFGLELEGMSPQDQELEVAQRLVRLTGDAAAQAAGAPTGMPPQEAARAALAAAAARHAPGLLDGDPGASPGSPFGGHPGPRHGGHQPSGRWVRHGHKIVVFGA
jgi:uncharacterized protein (DUF697 family)